MFVAEITSGTSNKKKLLWLDNITFNQKVGGYWIVSVMNLVWGTYWLNSSNSWTSGKCDITTCQDTCKNRRLKMMSQIRNFCGSDFLDMMMWCFVDIIKGLFQLQMIISFPSLRAKYLHRFLLILWNRFFLYPVRRG